MKLLTTLLIGERRPGARRSEPARRRRRRSSSSQEIGADHLRPRRWRAAEAGGAGVHPARQGARGHRAPPRASPMCSGTISRSRKSSTCCRATSCARCPGRHRSSRCRWTAGRSSAPTAWSSARCSKTADGIVVEARLMRVVNGVDDASARSTADRRSRWPTAGASSRTASPTRSTSSSATCAAWPGPSWRFPPIATARG